MIGSHGLVIASKLSYFDVFSLLLSTCLAQKKRGVIPSAIGTGVASDSFFIAA